MGAPSPWFPWITDSGEADNENASAILETIGKSGHASARAAPYLFQNKISNTVVRSHFGENAVWNLRFVEIKFFRFRKRFLFFSPTWQPTPLDGNLDRLQADAGFVSLKMEKILVSKTTKTTTTTVLNLSIATTQWNIWPKVKLALHTESPAIYLPRPHHGVGVTKPISSVLLLLNLFSIVKAHTLALDYHIHISQVSRHLSCSNTQ